MRLKSSGLILVLFAESKFPASENNLSEGVDVAGAARYILAIFDNTGYLVFLPAYHSKGFWLKEILSSAKYSLTSSDTRG